MTTKDSFLFYSNLEIHTQSLIELLGDSKSFSKVPEDWHVVLTDIKNSTIAVQNGQHELVNLIATGSIIAVLNIARKHNIEVPFFFGGDGATLIVPSEILKPVLGSLKKHSLNALRDFGLTLRVGSLPVSEIYSQNFHLKIAKLQLEKSFCIPIISGKGLIYAEDKIKSLDENWNDDTEDYDLDLSGMECRWNRIKPPIQTKEVICLLVVIRNQKQDLKIYKKVIESLEKIYGSKQERNPISVQGLKLSASLMKIGVEMQVKFGKKDWQYFLIEYLKTFFAKLFKWRNSDGGKYYFNRLVELSDTLVLDGRISTVISGTTEQREQLIQALNDLENAGQIFYGLQVSNESIMSCYVRDRQDQHIHFVDGSEGGYTFAAKQLKRKLREEKA